MSRFLMPHIVNTDRYKWSDRVRHWWRSRKRDRALVCIAVVMTVSGRKFQPTFGQARMYQWAEFPCFGAGHTLIMPVCCIAERMQRLSANHVNSAIEFATHVGKRNSRAIGSCRQVPLTTNVFVYLKLGQVHDHSWDWDSLVSVSFLN